MNKSLLVGDRMMPGRRGEEKPEHPAPTFHIRPLAMPILGSCLIPVRTSEGVCWESPLPQHPEMSSLGLSP